MNDQGIRGGKGNRVLGRPGSGGVPGRKVLGLARRAEAERQAGTGQPEGSMVRFGRVGGHPVMYEYRNGQMSRKVQGLFKEPDGGRAYYQIGDLIEGGQHGLKELKRMFPDSGVKDDDVSTWELIDAVVFGGNPAQDYQLVYRIDAIAYDRRQPWVGQIEVQAFVKLGEDWVPLEEPKARRIWDARANGGFLNQYMPQVPMHRGLHEMQTYISGVVGVTREVMGGVGSKVLSPAKKAATAAIKEYVNATKVGKAVLKSKLAKEAVKRAASLAKYIDGSTLAGAIAAFAKTFVASVKDDVKKYSLQQLAGKSSSVALDPTVAVTNVGFAEAAVIGPGGNQEANKPVAPTTTAVQINIQGALIKASTEFAYRILLPKGLLEAIGKASAKKLVGTVSQKRMKELVVGVVDAAGTTFWSGAIAAAAEKAMNDPQGKARYPEHLEDEMKDRAIKFFTADLVKSLLAKLIE